MKIYILLVFCAVLVFSVYGVNQTQSTEITIEAIDSTFSETLASRPQAQDRDNDLLAMNNFNYVKLNDSNVLLNQQKDTNPKKQSDAPKLGVVTIALIVLVSVGMILLLR